MNFLRTQNVSFELSPIKAIELEASRIKGVISLAQGIPSFSTPQVIKDYVHKKIEEGVCDKYSLTIGLEELREEIAASMAHDGLKYDPMREILCTAGSIEGITASLLASAQPGDEVILPSPTYTSYLGGIAMARCFPRYVALDEENNFDFQIEAIARAITKRTKVILYCNPNNPTGTIYSEANTRALMDLAEKHNLTVIVDEVYKDFYYGDGVHFSPAQLPNAMERLIRVCSFSKAYAMTGWRIGFLFANPDYMRRIVKFHDAMVTCAPVVSQYAGIAALRYGAPYLAEYAEGYRQRRDMAIRALDQMSHIFDYQTPRATYFVFPRVKDSVPLSRDVHKLAYDMLHRTRVAVVPGDAFGPTGQSHLRINYGRDLDVLRDGMDRIAEYFSAKRSASTVSKAPSEILTPTLYRSKASFTSWLLSFGARLYLKRNRPLIVGIAGVRGKTTYKRNIAALMTQVRRSRAGILSYNTELGLPLSILNLMSPRTLSERLSFPFRFLFQALLKTASKEVLILEYGIANEMDAQRLLEIAVPDWLVITPVHTNDINLDSRHAFAGILNLSKRVPVDHILWPANDPLFADAGWQGKATHAIAEPAQNPGERVVIQTPKRSYEVKREFVGHSANLSAVAATRLAELLGADEKQIERFLS